MANSINLQCTSFYREMATYKTDIINLIAAYLASGMCHGMNLALAMGIYIDTILATVLVLVLVCLHIKDLLGMVLPLHVTNLLSMYPRMYFVALGIHKIQTDTNQMATISVPVCIHKTELVSLIVYPSCANPMQIVLVDFLKI